ncbi:(Fe-S)-binding protein [Cellulomonas marina]|uniref:L-lactate dehydrogenase complex protein LldE n=1 Tax=Cellulomonas marina TaxID=988821 RepID=A0A1I1AD25_9CELL|nr:(Fe-S)-binding protein [Cellulomonas marina]GIG29725.1 glycolate oxidase [Cellulomonas marina]SFB35889.1 L-lactate dehydrogenase complex protein LldE [Cellulomonas marina]
MRIAIFATCLSDALFPQAAQATVRVLERLGHEVDVPAGQACCGQMHVNSGYQGQALPVIRNHVRAFEPVLDGEWDAVVAPSGSCVAATRHQQGMVCRRAGDERLARRAEQLAGRTYELSELLVDVLGVTDVGAWFPHRVTYHPTCHSLRMLRVGDRPTRLLRAVAGLELVDLPEADQCCGFGGTFSLKNSETSAAMVADKCANVVSTGAPYLTAGDWSCLMNISGALDRGGSGVRSLHLAEILAATREHPWRPEPEVAHVGRAAGRGAGRSAGRAEVGA